MKRDLYRIIVQSNNDFKAGLQKLRGEVANDLGITPMTAADSIIFSRPFLATMAEIESICTFLQEQTLHSNVITLTTYYFAKEHRVIYAQPESLNPLEAFYYGFERYVKECHSTIKLQNPPFFKASIPLTQDKVPLEEFRTAAIRYKTKRLSLTFPVTTIAILRRDNGMWVEHKIISYE